MFDYVHKAREMMVCITSEITSIDIVLLYRVGHPVETGIGNINFFLKKKKLNSSVCLCV